MSGKISPYHWAGNVDEICNCTFTWQHSHAPWCRCHPFLIDSFRKATRNMLSDLTQTYSGNIWISVYMVF
jgi:hypothetical protein